MRVTLAVWWSLAIFWLATKPLDAQPGQGKSVQVADDGWPSEVKGFGLNVDDAKQSAAERLLEDAEAFADVPHASLKGPAALKFAERAYLRGKGRAGPDFSVEKLGLTKTWIYPVKALDEVRRHARSEERINLGGRILAALTVIIALLGAGAWMKKQRHGAARKHVSAAK